MKLLNFERFHSPITVAPGEELCVVDATTGTVVAREIISGKQCQTFVGWQWAKLTEKELEKVNYNLPFGQEATVGVGGFLIGTDKKGLAD